MMRRDNNFENLSLKRCVYITAAILCLLSGCLEGADAYDDCRVDSENRQGYPGTRGTEVGSIIAPLEFVDPNGDVYSLEEVYQTGTNRVLLLTTSAGWCTACIEEQAALQTLYTDYAGRGVEILVTVFQKGDYEPADAGFAKQWKRRYELTYPVVADPPFVMQAYYPGQDASVTPILLVIDVETMTIRERYVGFDDVVVRALINNILNEGPS